MRHLPDVLAIIGAALIVAGVAMMHVPSAVIIGGAFAIFTAYSLSKASK